MPDPDSIPADLAQLAGEQQLEIKHYATSLGTIITRDNQRTTEFLAKMLAEIDRTCDQLCSEQVSAQVALLLQARCLIMILIFHFLLPPSDALVNFATHFDNKMFNLFTRRTDTYSVLHLGSLAHEQLVLLFRFAGRSVLSLKS
jgi:DNA-binding MurR/RpiR family transcriptional regulator